MISSINSTFKKTKPQNLPSYLLPIRVWFVNLKDLKAANLIEFLLTSVNQSTTEKCIHINFLGNPLCSLNWTACTIVSYGSKVSLQLGTIIGPYNFIFTYFLFFTDRNPFYPYISRIFEHLFICLVHCIFANLTICCLFV